MAIDETVIEKKKADEAPKAPAAPAEGAAQKKPKAPLTPEEKAKREAETEKRNLAFEEFVKANRDLLFTYARVIEVTHVLSWNRDSKDEENKQAGRVPSMILGAVLVNRGDKPIRLLANCGGLVSGYTGVMRLSETEIAKRRERNIQTFEERKRAGETKPGEKPREVTGNVIHYPVYASKLLVPTELVLEPGVPTTVSAMTLVALSTRPEIGGLFCGGSDPDKWLSIAPRTATEGGAPRRSNPLVFQNVSKRVDSKTGNFSAFVATKFPANTIPESLRDVFVDLIHVSSVRSGTKSEYADNLDPEGMFRELAEYSKELAVKRSTSKSESPLVRAKRVLGTQNTQAVKTFQKSLAAHEHAFQQFLKKSEGSVRRIARPDHD